jgi:hypothetical protein
MRQNPDWQVKCRQQSVLKLQLDPVPRQQTVVVPVPGPSAQIRFVLSAQHCRLLPHTEPSGRGLHRS